VDRIARSGGTPLAVSEDHRLMGVIHLKDIVKPGVKERFADLRRMGLRTVMITGDNPVTAATIASEAGVDDFLAEATPEDKLRLIREEQAKGRLVAMCGGRLNDAPALARPMSGGDADRHPGRPRSRQHGRPRQRSDQAHRDRRGRQTDADHPRALTTFSIANDVAKYFAIIPAMFVVTLPSLQRSTSCGCRTRTAPSCRRDLQRPDYRGPDPAALKGVRYQAIGAAGS